MGKYQPEDNQTANSTDFANSLQYARYEMDNSLFLSNPNVLNLIFAYYHLNQTNNTWFHTKNNHYI